MSVPVQSGGGSKTWLIGAGVGCGCLTLLVAAVVIVIVIAGLAGRSGGGGQPAAPGGQPAPAGQPAQPGAGQPQPAGPSQAPGGLQIPVSTVRVDQNRRPVAPTDQFQAGEVVGVVAQFVAIPQPVNLGFVWLKVEGEQNASPLAPPSPLQLTPDLQGKQAVITRGDVPAGRYVFVLFLPGAGDQIQVVASHGFEVVARP